VLIVSPPNGAGPEALRIGGADRDLASGMFIWRADGITFPLNIGTWVARSRIPLALAA
jgi:hypothetical protein